MSTFKSFNVFQLQTIKAVDAGKRMPPPPGCPRAVYQLMMKCWYVGLIKKQCHIILFFSHPFSLLFLPLTNFEHGHIRLISRHPDPSLRPTFTNIVETMTTLGSNIQDCWTEEDKAQNSQALVLGSSLHCAENLYPDLQHIYERNRTQTI